MPKRKRDKEQSYDEVVAEAERFRKHYIKNPIEKKHAVKRISKILNKSYTVKNGVHKLKKPR